MPEQMHSQRESRCLRRAEHQVVAQADESHSPLIADKD